MFPEGGYFLFYSLCVAILGKGDAFCLTGFYVCLGVECIFLHKIYHPFPF